MVIKSHPTPRARSLGSALFLVTAIASAQPYGIDQQDFPAAEFQQRRAKLFDAIGRQALALIPGASATDSPQVFRQSNEFYDLTGIAAPHWYLLLDGRARKITVYLPHRDPARERQIDSYLVQAEAVRALGKLGGHAALLREAAALKSPNDVVAAAAREGLAR